MTTHDALLAMLCTLKDVAFALVGHDLRVRELGGVAIPWPRLEVGASLRAAVPEIAEAEAEIRATLAAGGQFVKPWLTRPGRDRPRYYQLVMQQHPADPETWVCWMIDRTSYGRLKSRIDQYYRELIDQERNTVPDDTADPDITR